MSVVLHSVEDPSSEMGTIGNRGNDIGNSIRYSGTTMVERDHQKQTQSKISNETEVLPRFLLIKRKDGGDFGRTNPFQISRSLYGLLGEVKACRKVNDGLLVETNGKKQAQRLLDTTRFCDLDVEIIPHATLNYSKGVIFCKDLLNCTCDEIREGMKTQGVVEVKRISARRDGQTVETACHILTFNSTTLPKKVLAAIHSLEVRPYIPSPMRCFNCFKFGHTAIKCNRAQKCICGKNVHEDNEQCLTPPKCVNCEGTHSSKSKECPMYKNEVAIQKIKIIERLTYPEAKKKISNQTPTAGVSYAQTAQSKTPTVEEIIKKITPELVASISKNVCDVLGPTIRSTLTDRQYMPPPSKGSVTDTSIPEKRKRSPASYTEVDVQITTKPKKKPGWPKGKKRSVASESSQMSQEEVNDPQTSAADGRSDSDERFK